MRIRLKRKRLIEEMAKSRLTRAGSARRIGVSESYLSRLVNGERTCPGPRVRRCLLSVFNLELEELFEIVDTSQDEPLAEPPKGPIWRGQLLERTKDLKEKYLSAWITDLRTALRFCRNNPGFTLISTGLLGLGIGVNCAIFGLLNALVLQPLPFPNSEDLVSLHTTYPEMGADSISMSYPDVLDFKTRSKRLADLAVWAQASLNLRGREAPERIKGFRVSANFFRLLGISATQGRVFSVQDSASETSREVIIAQRLFLRLYGEDPDLLGQTIMINGTPRTVIGVVPDFRFMGGGVDAWLTLDPAGWQKRTARGLSVVGRLSSGSDLESARAELTAIASALESEYPEANKGRGIRVQSFGEAQRGDVGLVLMVLNGVAFVILLIACANVSNLLLSRAVGRRHESAVRMALGAARWRIIRHGLTESLLIAFLGALAGLGLVWVTFRILIAYLPPEVMLEEGELWQPAVFGFALTLAVVTSILFGILPASLLARTDTQVWLRSGGRGGGSTAGARIRGVFVAVQVAVAIILLASAGLMLNSLVHLWAVDIGFDPNHVLTMRLDLLGERYETPESRILFSDRLIGRLEAIPGVQSAALTTSLPLGFSTTQTTVRLPEEPIVSLAESRLSVIYRVSPGLLSTLGIPLRQGRGISSRDTAQSPPVVVVNQTLARRLWGQEPAVGKVVFLEKDDVREVVGVVADTIHTDRKEKESQLYIPYTQQPVAAVRIMLRGWADVAALTPQIRAAVHEIDPDRPIYDIAEMDDVVLFSLAETGLAGILISSFALLALVMSALGVYGLISFWVKQNTHELGIRVALGASRQGLIRHVLMRSLREVLIGCAIGMLGGALVGQILGRFLFQVGALDPVSFGTVVLLILGTAGIACYLPTRRALRVDPLTALRCE